MSRFFILRTETANRVRSMHTTILVAVALIVPALWGSVVAWGTTRFWPASPEAAHHRRNEPDAPSHPLAFQI
jgi:hypothetical protein